MYQHNAARHWRQSNEKHAAWPEGVSHQSIRTITKVSGCYGRKILFSRIILPAQRSTKNSSRQTLRMYFSMRVGRWKRGEVLLSTVQISTDLSAMPWKHRALPPSAPGIQERSPWAEELCTDSSAKRQWYSGWEMVWGSLGKRNKRQWLWGNVWGKLHPDDLSIPFPSLPYHLGVTLPSPSLLSVCHPHPFISLYFFFAIFFSYSF